MIDAAIAASQQIFTRPFRSVLYKTLALTLALLAAMLIVLTKLILYYIVLPYAWANTILGVLAGLGLLVALAYAVVPASFVVAGFYFDSLAEIVERESEPHGPIGRAMPLPDAVWLAVKFALVAVLVNAIALLLLLIPGVNAVAFFGANAYLFGRGYFELSALRYLPIETVHRLRRCYALRLFMAGLVVAVFVLVPVLNLLTPLFATAFMVRITKTILRPELTLQPAR